MKRTILLASISVALTWNRCNALINRKALVSRFNPTRNASSLTTPMQVGNGNFAFGADVTGLQTFQPFGILSSWGWKNDSLPLGVTQADVDDYKGVSWLNHGRPVQYDFGGGNPIEQWLISNPNRVNLGRIGLQFMDAEGNILTNVTENDLRKVSQKLDLWTGIISSSFELEGAKVLVEVACAQDTDVVGIRITSGLVKDGRLGMFLDFPWNDGSSKFSAPFVGNWSVPEKHTSVLTVSSSKIYEPGKVQAEITHEMDGNSFFTSLAGDDMKVTRLSPSTHRYIVRPSKSQSNVFSIAVAFGNATAINGAISSPSDIFESSRDTWQGYWLNHGFVDVLTGSSDSRAPELQRRIILSRYLMKVNEAGSTPPQESGLTNNGWVSFLKMYFWHSIHWALWSNWDLLSRSNDIYSRFLRSSIQRAQIQQGWPAGARWPKMTDPSGRSAPGEINNLLIWEQPHPLVFAEYEYRAFPTAATLQKWEDVVKETADWMAAFAWWNETSGVYDIGPPMYIVSEDTSPNVTRNAAFELSYWRFGLGLAETWMQKLGKEVPVQWTNVRNKLAKLPSSNGTYDVYEGIEPDFWTDPAFTSNHPALVGLHGWLPPTQGLDINMAKATAEKVWASWNATDFWGWDFPMLAMSAARNGNPDKAIDWLLSPLFTFDDVGMPGGGVQVPTPYFPGAGALLLAVAMMSAGWDGSTAHAPGFPEDGWKVEYEGISKAL
ncbi:hypothetical protein JR316_0002570 [Psilocybe cubensis]|uniref:Uncharacterized protein n=2 Tax=Psilocybe cubensis TaxID=181762 RepID=A0ACB8HET7_PSICU|nr:hypothetical protein JR316_0002570 [Psilocybe cubensis]KAH9485660.1 hypothetical protein JR316_0002570 [Psilocybe cubensis]